MKIIKKLFFKYIVYLPQIIFISPMFILIIVIFFPFFKIRVNKIIGHRIGHFAANTDIYFTKKNFNKNKDIDINFLISKPCNKQLLKMWKKKFIIYPHFLIYPHYRVLKFLSKHVPLMKFFLADNNNERDLDGFINISKPNLVFSDNEIKEGEIFLNSFNLTLKDKFVCLIIRNENYLREKFPEKKWNYHSYRNMDFDNFIKTINYLNQKGIMVFNMGDNPGKKINIKNKLFFDYSSSELKSEFLDIFLGAHCYFCLSTDTGFDQIPFIFRRPIAYITDPIGALKSFNKRSMSIFSHYYSISEKKNFSLKQIFNEGISIFNKTSEIEEEGIDLLKPNQDEIENLVKDFIPFIDNNYTFSDEQDEIINKKFFKTFQLEVSKNTFIMSLKNRRKITKYHNNFAGSVSPSFLRSNNYIFKS